MNRHFLLLLRNEKWILKLSASFNALLCGYYQLHDSHQNGGGGGQFLAVFCSITSSVIAIESAVICVGH